MWAVLGDFYDKLAGTGFETANTMRKIAADYQQTQGTLPDIGYAVFSGFLVVMVIIATLLCAAIGFVISAFGLFALALLSVVGPLFVAALLFESTRGYFFAWLGACINYLMLIVFALVLTLFLTQTGDAIIATISENDEIGMAAIKALAFYALGFFFLPANSDAGRLAWRRRACTRQSVCIGHCSGGRVRRRTRCDGYASDQPRHRTRLCPRHRADADVWLGQPWNNIKGQDHG